ncbi:MAG: hypothetical protein JWL77_6624 [Chthonomonadaceae bacterium]|nr:hypothetical protein [Chthonomonadaceae bacterium]
MTQDTISLLTLLFGSLPILWYSRKMIREIGFGLWFFSPLPIFWFSFIVAFVVRPILDSEVGLRYPSTTYEPGNFLYAQSLATISCYMFVWGYSVVKSRREGKPTAPSEAYEPSYAAIPAQRAAFLLSAIFQVLFAAILFDNDALTLSLGDNRAHYSMIQVGGGQVTLVIGLASIFLFMGMMMTRWTNRLGRLGIAATTAYLALNILVTNRSFVVTEMLIGLLIYFVLQNRKRKRVSPLKLIVLLGVIAGVGVGLSLARFIGAPPQEDLTRPALNPYVAPIAYLAVTFDMSELFQETIKRTDNAGYEWGSSWVEDVFYTYLPRAVFPEKPIKYGVFRVQDEVVPGLTPESGVFTSSYPIGAWGESYINFGPIGVLITLFALGAWLKYLYVRSLELIYDSKVNWPSILFMIIYAILGLNPLVYMRSIGQFLFGQLYLTAVLWGSLRLILTMAQLIDALLPARGDGAGEAASAP